MDSSDSAEGFLRKAECPVDGASLPTSPTSEASLPLYAGSGRDIDADDWRHNYADGDYHVGIIERLLAQGCEMGPSPTYGENPGDSLF